MKRLKDCSTSTENICQTNKSLQPHISVNLRFHYKHILSQTTIRSEGVTNNQKNSIFLECIARDFRRFQHLLINSIIIIKYLDSTAYDISQIYKFIFLRLSMRILFIDLLMMIYIILFPNNYYRHVQRKSPI